MAVRTCSAQRRRVDRFEYLFGLVCADFYEKRTQNKALWNLELPPAWLVFRNQGTSEDILKVADQEVAASGNS
jgi:hypothetical protein